MLKLATLTIAAVALIGSTPAEAKIRKPERCHSKMELRVLEQCQAHAVKYAEVTVRFYIKHRRFFERTPWAVHREYSRLKWLRRELKETRAKLRPRIRYLSAWICIHNGEGAWNANTGNGYYGGLQMDAGFQSTYGSDMIRKYGGYAHLWSPSDQMLVAERAHRSGRGFYPWPNTARECGLI